MARFINSTENDLQELTDSAKNKNTTRSTNTWIRLYQQWAETRNENINLETYSPLELDKVLSRFYAEVRKQDGLDYEPDCLRVMQSSLHRYLTEKKYVHNILKDVEFLNSRNVLEGKARVLRSQGMGKRKNASKSLTNNEETYYGMKVFGTP